MQVMSGKRKAFIKQFFDEQKAACKCFLSIMDFNLIFRVIYISVINDVKLI